MLSQPSSNTSASQSPAFPQRYLTTEDAATISGLSRSFFEKKRVQASDGPPFMKIGRVVRYPATEFYDWLDSHVKQQNTAQLAVEG